MTQIDQFESIFRAASKTKFEYSDWSVQKILTVGDGSQQESTEIENQVKEFVSNSFEVDAIEWESLNGNGFSSVKQLIDKVHESSPDLICCRRNLHIAADEYPYSLGVYVEVLTQATDIPVLLLPTPDADSTKQWHSESRKVIAITDHLDDDALLVNAAIKMTADEGTLHLAHIEDEKAFGRFMHVVEKIAEIDSETAHEKIKERLLLGPTDFVESCRQGIDAEGIQIKVESVVQMGHNLSVYKELVESNEVDLVVLHTKDDDQLAMHGLAYPLAVELHQTPMLLI